MAADFKTRTAKARAATKEHGLDWLIVPPSADLTYLTGVHAEPGDRLTVLLVPAEGEAVLLMPLLEAAAIEEDAAPASLVRWSDGADPRTLIAERLDGARAVGVGGSFWARDLLVLQAQLASARIVEATALLTPLRLTKDVAELDALRRAAHAADRVAARIAAEGLGGRTEGAVAARVEEMIIEEGHDKVSFRIVASGPHGAQPHYSGGTRTIEQGDLVVLDFGGSIDGYHSDITRTFAVGDPGPDARAVYEAVRRAQEVGVQEAAKQNATTGGVDRAVRAVLEGAGFGEYVVHRTGHGLGQELHEPPYIVDGDETVLTEGMVFSIEPGLYLPGRFGVRIEDIVAFTADGVERLNQADRSLQIVS